MPSGSSLASAGEGMNWAFSAPMCPDVYLSLSRYLGLMCWHQTPGLLSRPDNWRCHWKWPRILPPPSYQLPSHAAINAANPRGTASLSTSLEVRSEGIRHPWIYPFSHLSTISVWNRVGFLFLKTHLSSPQVRNSHDPMIVWRMMLRKDLYCLCPSVTAFDWDIKWKIRARDEHDSIHLYNMKKHANIYNTCKKIHFLKVLVSSQK